ncbi:MAG: translation initiation factor IF-2, partial [Gracilimonas sp.]
MSSKRPKPLFKVASEFNVSTQSIVDALNDNGFDIANRPNFKVTPEMLSALDEVYGEDKAKSEDHDRAREEYESRRSQMMSQRNDSVTIDNVLEPIEDEIGLEPEEDVPDLEPVDEEPEAEKKPVPQEEEVAAEEEEK